MTALPPQHVGPEAWSAATTIAQRLLAEGAEAVVLAGSHARGTAGPESDLDLYALGTGSEYRLERFGEFLVSISWLTAAEVDASFRSPLAAGGTVPGWRTSIVVADPRGCAAEIISAARAWSWEVVGSFACNAAVAEEICGYAEEVHKLVRALNDRRLHMAAVQRSVLALRLARVMALHTRLLYVTENELWDAVAVEMGPAWQRVQAAALSEDGESLEVSCMAALDLYRLAWRAAVDLLDARQAAVVEYAGGLIAQYQSARME